MTARRRPEESPNMTARRRPEESPEMAFRRRRAAVAATVLATFVAHGFLFSNEFFSHDSVSYFAYSEWGFDFYTGIGRFLIPVYEYCKGGVAAPWLIGILFALWMSLAGIVITGVLQIRSLPGIALSCALLVTNVSLSLTGATYVYCMDEYALALLFAALSAAVFLRGGALAPLGVIPLLACLSIYQPYLTVTASLCLLALLRQASDGRRVGAILPRGVACLALIALSFLIYNALWNALRVLVAVPQTRDVTPLSDFGVIPRLISAYRAFFAFLFRSGGVLGLLRPVAHGLLLVLLLWRLLRTLSNGRLPVPNRVLILLLACLLPAALHSVSIAMPGEAHDLTAFARELLYLLPLSLLDDVPASGRSPRRVVNAERVALFALLSLLLWRNVVYANQVYMKKDLEKNSTLILAARIIDRIESVNGYIPGETRVAFVGRLDYNAPLDGTRPAFEDLRGQTGLWHSHAATYNLGRYITDYLQYPLLWDQESSVTRSELARAMPQFPAPGSVRMIEGVVVVKLSGTAPG